MTDPQISGWVMGRTNAFMNEHADARRASNILPCLMTRRSFWTTVFGDTDVAAGLSPGLFDAAERRHRLGGIGGRSRAGIGSCPQGPIT